MILIGNMIYYNFVNAHKKILSKAAEKYTSKSEYVRQLVLSDIGMTEEINCKKLKLVPGHKSRSEMIGFCVAGNMLLIFSLFRKKQAVTIQLCSNVNSHGFYKFHGCFFEMYLLFAKGLT